MQAYIESYAEEAIYQMLEYRVPASVTMAQAIFESQSGGSELARRSNNHFGIKCHLEWGGDTVVKHDDTLNECFRKYRFVHDSYTDHSMFLRSRARYASLFELPLNDYRGWCHGLKAAGYATYPSYAEDLINLIEQLRLYELDGYQNLDAVNVFNQRNPEPVAGPEKPACPLWEIAGSGLLWADERDFLVQSLELMIAPSSEPEEETIAEPALAEEIYNTPAATQPSISIEIMAGDEIPAVPEETIIIETLLPEAPRGVLGLLGPTPLPQPAPQPQPEKPEAPVTDWQPENSWPAEPEPFRYEGVKP